MRTKKVLLSEAEVLSVARHFDFLEHSLCCMLYKVCNDRLIEPTTMSNVIGWLNLKGANPPICIKSKQKTRCCYLFKEISTASEFFECGNIANDFLIDGQKINEGFRSQDMTPYYVCVRNAGTETGFYDDVLSRCLALGRPDRKVRCIK